MTATSAAGQTDRYVSFAGIDFDGNMQTVLEHLFRYINDPEKTNPFWERFKERLAKASGDASPMQDKLLLLHSHVYYMVELFEEHEDEDALRDLKKLEEECF